MIDSSLKTDKEAWDGVNYVDLEEDDDFIQKALSIKAGEDYDTRVSVPIDLPDDVAFELMKRAHDRDITFNQMVEEVLWAAINAERDQQLEDQLWDDLAEDDIWDDEMPSDLEDVKPAAAMKAKKKKKK